jgi:hypothetical protein
LMDSAEYCTVKLPDEDYQVILCSYCQHTSRTDFALV